MSHRCLHNLARKFMEKKIVGGAKGVSHTQKHFRNDLLATFNLYFIFLELNQKFFILTVLKSL